MTVLSDRRWTHPRKRSATPRPVGSVGSSAVPPPTPGPLPSNPVPSDSAPSVLDVGRGDVRFAVVSMSKRSADGDDAGYLRWHVLDHLPEQHRIDGMRNGTRWFSNGACRSARAASEAPYADVDHIVAYLFGGPDDP